VADRRPGALDQDGLQVLVALAPPAGAAFPGGFVITRAQPGPGRQVRGIGEVLPDVGAGLGDDRGGGQQADPGGRGQQLPGGAKGGHHRLDLGVQPGGHRLQVIDVIQVQAAHQGVMVPEPALQGHRQVRDLGPHLALGQLGQDRAAALPVDQRLDHRPPGLRRDRGGDGIDLDPGVLQHVAQPGDLADPLPGHLGPVPDHVPGRLDLGRGDEAAGQQPALQQVRQPLRIGEIRLAARHVLHVPGVAHQHLLKIPVLQQGVIDRHRIDPGRLHRHVRHAQPGQPAGRLRQHPVERLVHPLDRGPAIRAVTGQPDRHRNHVLAHVDRGAPLIHHLHACLLRERP
jgi:hypothetical protein